MITIHNVNQGTKEWFDLKLQNPLSSSHAQAIGNQGKGLETLIWEKLAEKHSTASKEKYTNKDLERGVELEPLARSMYELKTGNKVQEVGFITNSDYKLAGASTDGLIADDGVLEIKCFEDKKHFRMILDGNILESGYEWQCQMELLITARKWLDFVVYNPNFQESLIITRVLPNPEMQEELIKGLKKGEEIINNIEKQWKELR